MSAPYSDLVTTLRQAFPQPVSDRLHDAYFVFSFLRALDQVDAMKSETPLLGGPVTVDYTAAKRSRVADDPQSLEQVTQQLVSHLAGMFIWGHPRAQINVVPFPTIPSVIGGLLPSIYNPNLVSEESSRQVAVAEVEVSAMTAELLGYDSTKSAGLFTFGGTGTLLYGVKLGLEKCSPGVGRGGVTEPPVILCSEQAHYACLAVANWLGIGQDNVIQVPCTPENEIRTCLLESMARDVLKSGRKIAAIVATMGTTDHFGLDDLETIHGLRERLVDEFRLDYRPHIHADAVIGWAWSVFNDYDFPANRLGFRSRTVRALAGTRRRIVHLPLADSIGIDFHKTGFAPYVSSLFLAKDSHDLELICRRPADTPYLFHDGHYHPGRYTLETTRSGAGPMAALANLRLFGKQGLRALLGHLVTMSELLREQLEGQPFSTVVNRGNFGPVTLFRVYPDDVDTFQVLQREQTDASYRDQLRIHNDYNRRVFQLVQQEALQGRGVVISLTDCYRESDYGEPIVALKSYILSPFSEEKYVDAVLESLSAARSRIAAEEERNLA
ncbi:MAG TPA: pyridoxal-dependent decarboxylase [Planctomycetaceae bacterium]|nr:pyridoxal-dependent decarboxylase [Planctomycetaceae bacterium]